MVENKNTESMIENALQILKQLKNFTTPYGVDPQYHEQEIKTFDGFTTFYFYLPVTAKEAAIINWDFIAHLVDENLNNPLWSLCIIGTKTQLKSVK